MFCLVGVQKLLSSHNITHFTSQPGQKQTTSIAERFNRTLRNLMARNMTRIGKLHWLTNINALVKNYNTSVHSTIQCKPIDVWTGVAKPCHPHPHREPFPFKSGDHVRLWIVKGVFEKRAGTQRWSNAVYEIKHREGFRCVVENKH